MARQTPPAARPNMRVSSSDDGTRRFAHPRVGRLRFGAIRIPEKWSPPFARRRGTEFGLHPGRNRKTPAAAPKQASPPSFLLLHTTRQRKAVPASDKSPMHLPFGVGETASHFFYKSAA